MRKLMKSVLLFILCCYFMGCGKPTEIDINSYVEVEFDGYNTLGTISKYNVDAERLFQDYEKELLNISKELIKNSLLDSIKFDKNNGLSNGDIVTVMWDVDLKEINDIEQKNNIKFNFNDFVVEVKELDIMEIFDPFENITVHFEGISPYVSASIKDERSAKDVGYFDFYYKMSKQSGLLIGDVVTVTVSSLEKDFIDFCVKNFGMIPSTQTKDFVVEGCDRYISRIGDVSSTEMEILDSVFRREIEQKIKNRYICDDNANIEFMGNMFLKLKEEYERMKDYTGDNVLFSVYRVKEANAGNGSYYYYCCGINNLIINSIGELSYDLKNVELTEIYQDYQEFYDNYVKPVHEYYEVIDTVDKEMIVLPSNEVEEVKGGKVLNIYSWNDEFQRRVEDHYPNYEIIDNVTGMIGDITVKWCITSTQDNAYQNNLDDALMYRDRREDDEKVDIFLVELDYAKKYIETEYTLSIDELGINADDLSTQYKYVQDVVTDSIGDLKALAWQACPGVFFYNREAAKKMFGTDSSEYIQSLVTDWDSFLSTAEKVKADGYQMISSVMDTYRVYANNATNSWVHYGRITIDENIIRWVNDSKRLVEAGMAGTHSLWTKEWSKGFYPDGKVFGYFGPAWLINFSMAADKQGSIANQGGWGATEGPQAFFWGGTWICVSSDTDNKELVKQLLLALTVDESIMSGIVIKDDDFVNNKIVMEKFAEDKGYQSRVLGRQNPLSAYHNNAEKIALAKKTNYDVVCDEKFQKAMQKYLQGTYSYEDALEEFYTEVIKYHPELSR